MAKHDWANVGYHYANALNRVGVQAKAVKEFPHTFYENGQAEVVQERGRMRALIRGAECICIMHSALHSALKPLKAEWRKKFVVVFHGGKAYRHGHQKLNRFFNPQVNMTLVQTHDLLGKGAKNEHWVNLTLDVSNIKPRYYQGGRYVVGHFPRDSKLKRTQDIQRALSEVVGSYRARQKRAPFVSRVNTDRLPWHRNLKRMSLCDIYLGSMSMQDPLGFDTGEWGFTAIEAAAVGDIVLTAFVAKGPYEKAFGRCPFAPITSHQDLVRHLRQTIETPPGRLIELQREHREWAERVCSYEAVGNHLKSLFSQV